MVLLGLWVFKISTRINLNLFRNMFNVFNLISSQSTDFNGIWIWWVPIMMRKSISSLIINSWIEKIVKIWTVFVWILLLPSLFDLEIRSNILFNNSLLLQLTSFFHYILYEVWRWNASSNEDILSWNLEGVLCWFIFKSREDMSIVFLIEIITL